jgi:hypothetical protein
MKYGVWTTYATAGQSYQQVLACSMPGRQLHCAVPIRSSLLDARLSFWELLPAEFRQDCVITLGDLGNAEVDHIYFT